MSVEFLEKPRHQDAWTRFLELGFPTKETESYRYVRLSDLQGRKFSSHEGATKLLTAQPNTLVFVNGSYSEALSQLPKGIVALPLSKAFNTYGSFLHSRMGKLAKEEKDPFAALNHSFFSEGLFLYVPPKYSCEAPLRVIHYVEGVESSVHLCPRLHVCLAKESTLSLILEEKGSNAEALVNGCIDCAIEERACLTFTRFGHYSETGHHFWALRATLKAKAAIKTTSITNGAATSREDYLIRLQGEAAEASLNGVWNLNNQRQHHAYIWMEHEAPHCHSLQKFKGVLADGARSSFEGKIYVRQAAQKTEAYQMNNNLILGKRATANSKPNLEIFADDVKASHGSTVGQIDAEHLFYLMARGIPEATAHQLLVRGFIKEIIETLDTDQLRLEAEQIVL